VAAVVGGSASAFHPGSDFDKSPGAGGGGGIFYAGVPREKGWTCAACHIDAPGKIKLSMVSSLVTDRRYSPGQAYPITVQLVGEHAGLGSPQSNYNTMAVAAVLGDGSVGGRFSGYAPEDFYDGTTTLVSAGKKVGVTSWTFTWNAPSAMLGPVTIYLCVVDGNGANAAPGVTLTDPFGDDVACGSVTVTEAIVGSREPIFRPLATQGKSPHENEPIASLFDAGGLQRDDRRALSRRSLSVHRRGATGYGESGAGAGAGDLSPLRQRDACGRRGDSVRRSRQRSHRRRTHGRVAGVEQRPRWRHRHG